jgi:hypothetical protein
MSLVSIEVYEYTVGLNVHESDFLIVLVVTECLSKETTSQTSVNTSSIGNQPFLMCHPMVLDCF